MTILDRVFDEADKAARLESENKALRRQLAELTTACEAVLAWWGRVYPPDIFDGSSGNENALEIVRIRNMVCAALGRRGGDGEEETG